MRDDDRATIVRLGTGSTRRLDAIAPPGTRSPGLPLPAWIIAGGVSIVLIIVGVVIVPGLLTPGAAPENGGVGALSTAGVQSSTSPAPTQADPSTSASPVPTSPAPVDSARPLQVRVTSSPSGAAGLGGWAVTATITNPASVDQAWHSLSVQVDAALSQSAVTSRTAGVHGYVSASNNRLACVSPTGDGLIGAGATITVEFHIALLRLLDRPPHHGQLDDPNCQPPQAG